MEVFEDYNLKKYNTMRLNSIASDFYIPVNRDELISCISNLNESKQKYYTLSAGSNVIISEYIKSPIIYLMKLDDSLKINNEGLIECGCSVRIQKLIRFLQKNNLGGIEYLYSVPSSIGGATFMNAGRGRQYNMSISDFIVKVEYLDINSMKIKIIDVNNEYFGYRKSWFQTIPCIITKVYFKFPKQDPLLTEKLIKERIEHSNKFLDAGKPSCGSVFNKCNPIIMRLLKGYSCGGAVYSKKTSNWISNKGNATSIDVKKLINKAVKLHHLLCLKYNIEYRFFD